MAKTTTYETLIKVGAKYQGEGFNKAQRAIDKTSRGLKHLGGVAKDTHGKMKAMWGAMAGAAGAVGIAFAVKRITDSVLDLGKAAYSAAADVQRTHEEVTRLIAVYRGGIKNAEKIEKKFYDIADAMEQSKERGLDVEAMTRGMGALTKSMPDDKIIKNLRLFSDYVTTVYGTAANADQIEAAAEAFNDAILKGSGEVIDKMPWSKASKRDFANKMITPEQRYEILFGKKGAMTSYANATTLAMKTATGRVDYGLNQLGNRLEDLGANLVSKRGEIGDMFTEIAEKLKPITKELGEKITPKVMEIVDYVNQHMPEITKLMYVLADAVLWIAKTFTIDLIQSFTNVYNQITWLHDMWDKSIKDTTEQLKKLYDWFMKVGQAATDWMVKAGLLPPVSAVGQGAAWQHRIPQASDFQGGGGDVGAAGEGAAGGAASNARMADARAKLIEEVNSNPAVRARLYARVKGEVGGQGADAIQKEMETIFNRAILRGQTVAETVAQGGKAGNYWGSRMKPTSEQEAKLYDLLLAGVRAGSTKAGSASGNESDWLRNGKVVATAKGGERFVEEPADAARIHKLRDLVNNPNFAEGPTKKAADALEAATKMQKQGTTAWPGGVKYKDQSITPSTDPLVPKGSSLKDAIKDMTLPQRMEGASGGQNVAYSPNVTINNATPGEGEAQARAIMRALQDPDKQLLVQLKRARSQAERLGYV